MSLYVIAQLAIHDRQRYDAYARAFGATLDGYGGRLLAADNAVSVVEGEWRYDKIVLLEFDSRNEFERWATSNAYEAIAQDRRAAASGPVVAVAGIGAVTQPPQ